MSMVNIEAQYLKLLYQNENCALMSKTTLYECGP